MKLDPCEFPNFESYMNARQARWQQPTIACDDCGRMMKTADADDLGGNPVCDDCRDKILDKILAEDNQKLNETLEARLAQINSALEAHEVRLAAMIVPRNVWVMYDWIQDEDREGCPQGRDEFYIGMIKVRGAWRLCHATQYQSYSGWSEGICWKPIVEVSIEERIRAAAHIHELKEAIVHSKEELIPDVEKAIGTLAKSLNAI